jgi:hypothetical protein
MSEPPDEGHQEPNEVQANEDNVGQDLMLVAAVRKWRLNKIFVVDNVIAFQVLVCSKPVLLIRLVDFFLIFFHFQNLLFSVSDSVYVVADL